MGVVARWVAVLAGAAWSLVVSPSMAAAPGSAEQAYIDNCSACHQKTGLGIPGAFPALKGDKILLGDPRIMAVRVLNGRGGMPAFKDSLSDAELARITSYVRASWGNKAGVVTAPVFAAARRGPPPSARLQAH